MEITTFPPYNLQCSIPKMAYTTKPKFDLLVNIFNIFAYKVSITLNLENHDAYTLSISWVKTFLSLITIFILNRTNT